MFFRKKDISQYKVLDSYKIDIEETNQLFQIGIAPISVMGGREFCELVAENERYYFYSYRTYKDGSGGYILRQDKHKPRRVVFFGTSKQHNIVYRNYLFQVDSSGELGRYAITARHVSTGKLLECNWLSNRAKFFVINGYGRFYCQDSVKAVLLIRDKLIFRISRTKSNAPHQQEESFDKYDITVDYNLVVEYSNEGFKATPIFPPM